MNPNALENVIDYGQQVISRRRAELAARGLQSLRRNSQVLRVVSGHAWVTFDGKDVYMDPNDELLLARGRTHAVISALGDSPLVYEIVVLQSPERVKAA